MLTIKLIIDDLMIYLTIKEQEVWSVESNSRKIIHYKYFKMTSILPNWNNLS